MNRPKIVGAGYAGLSCAFYLAQRGISSDIYESRNIIGGRAFSAIDAFTGELIDNGQHIMSTAYFHFLEIVSAIGTYKNLDINDYLDINFKYSNGKKDRINLGVLPGNLGAFVGVMMMKSIPFSEKFQFLRFLAKLKSNKLNLVDKSVLELLKEHKTSDQLIKLFWEPFVISAFNTPIEIASSKLLAEVIRRTIGNGASGMIIPKKGLSELIDPLIPYLESKGCKFYLKERVNKLNFGKTDNFEASDSTNYLYDIRTPNSNIIESFNTANGNSYSCSRVVFAVPIPVLSNLLGDRFPLVHTFSNYEYSSITSVYLWFSSELDSPNFEALIGTTSHWLFNRRAIISPPTNICKPDPGFNNGIIPGHITITISNSNELAKYSNQEIAQMCFSEVQTLYPSIKLAKLIHSKVITVKNATFLATNHFNDQRPKPGRLMGNSYICGDWTDTGIPATIEGACQSGFECAQDLANSY